MICKKQNNVSIVGFSKALHLKPINCMPGYILFYYNNIFECVLYKHYNGDFAVKNSNIAVIE